MTHTAKKVACLRVWLDEEGDFLEVTFAKPYGIIPICRSGHVRARRRKMKGDRFCDFQLYGKRAEDGGNSSGGSKARDGTMTAVTVMDWRLIEDYLSDRND